jgi:AcrR family transcriptional regulator
MRQGTSTRDEVCAVALRLLEKEGASHVTMRRVAKAVGVSAMAIYHYFPSREALLAAVAEAAFRELHEAVTAVVGTGSAVDQLLAMIDQLVNFSLKHPRVVEYVFAAKRQGARRYPRDFRRRRSPLFNRFTEVVGAAMNEGDLRKDDVVEVGMTLWGQVHGLGSLYRADRFDLTRDEFRVFVRRSIGRLLSGLRQSS